MSVWEGRTAALEIKSAFNNKKRGSAFIGIDACIFILEIYDVFLYYFILFGFG